jgi:pimeloyl-ACP methyl ester carboxylesterase
VEALTRSVDAHAVRFFVREWGERGARPVLFWHGLGGTGAQIEDVATLLAEEHGLRVIAPDAPGCGRSPALDRAGYESQASADQAAALLTALELPRAVVVGFSWGATVACYLAAGHPERLEALVLLDGGYLDVVDFPWVDANGSYEERLERIGSGREWARLGETSAPVWAAIVDAGVRMPPSAVLEQLPAELPVLVLAASEPASMKGLREARLTHFRIRVPQADVRVLAGVSHDVVGEAADDAARLIGEWLRRE